MDKIKEHASETIVSRLGWQTATKDQAALTEDIANGGDIGEIYGLGEAGLFDEFFFFLREIGAMSLFDALEPSKLHQRASNVKFSAVILIYLMRIVSGLRFFWHIEPVLLMSQPLMQLIGFNGHQILKGTTRRGLQEKELDQATPEHAEPAEIRGPVSADSVAAYIQAIAAKALEKAFNSTITLLAAASFFPKHIHALLDASEIESTEQCQGRGKVRKDKAPELRRRKGRLRKVSEIVFGFKIWVIWDPNSKLPLAMRFATIEVADCVMTREIIEQAIADLKTHARIASIAIDKRFIDVALLWWLNSNNIIFYIPAKSTMDVYHDAL